MRKLITVLMGVAFLAACGAEAPPERPSAPTGLSISGQVTAGLARKGG